MNIIECMNDLPEGITFPNGMAAVDCEMMGLEFHRDRLCLVQVGDGEGNAWLVKFDGTTWDAPNLKALLEDSRILKLFHYGRKDFCFLKHYLDINVAPIFDTKIASKLTRTYTERHGLKNLVEEVLGAKVSKEAQSSYWGAAVLTEEQKAYAASDVEHLHALKVELEQRLKDLGRLELAQSCFDFMPQRVALDLAGWEEVDIFAH